MRKLLVMAALATMVAASAAAVAAATSSSSGTTELGPFRGSGIQIGGSCGNIWGTLSATTRYSVYPPNRDGSTTAVQTVDGVLVTAAGQSPGACNGGPDNGSTIAAGVRVHLHAVEIETISGGTFNPNARCAAQCFTAAFVPAFFGAGATVHSDLDFGDWMTNCNGRYVSTGSSQRSAGDITGARQRHCG